MLCSSVLSLSAKDQPRAPKISYNLDICFQQMKETERKILILEVDFPCFP